MGYEARTTTIDHPGVDTTRTDYNDSAANDAQSFLLVAAGGAGQVVGTLTWEQEQSGQELTWSIVSGNGLGHFALNQNGVLTRTQALGVGPYALVLRYAEGAPLFRFRDIDLTVTVA